MLKIAVIFLFCLSNAAFSYVPPSSYILKTWVKKRNFEKGIRIKSKILDPKSNVSVVVWTDLDVPSQTYRVQIKNLNSKNIYKLNKSIHDHKLPTLASNFLFMFQPDALLGFAKRTLNLKLEDDVKLLRDSDSIYWIMSGKSNQVLIEKDTFLPQKIKENKDGEIIETIFSNFRSSREVMFPRSIEVKNAESVILREEITEIVNFTDKKDIEDTSSYFADEMNSDSDIKNLVSLIFRVLR